jgi:hypothetical protein
MRSTGSLLSQSKKLHVDNCETSNHQSVDGAQAHHRRTGRISRVSGWRQGRTVVTDFPQGNESSRGEGLREICGASPAAALLNAALAQFRARGALTSITLPRGHFARAGGPGKDCHGNAVYWVSRSKSSAASISRSARSSSTGLLANAAPSNIEIMAPAISSRSSARSRIDSVTFA